MTPAGRNGDRPDEPRAEGRSWNAEDVERTAEEWAARAAGWLARTATRAKEEAEDMWAEAQELRRRQ
ncbi:MAG: hypothetical protein ACXVFN_18760 [Solirubrobacteraceae bacterium]